MQSELDATDVSEMHSELGELTPAAKTSMVFNTASEGLQRLVPSVLGVFSIASTSWCTPGGETGVIRTMFSSDGRVTRWH